MHRKQDFTLDFYFRQFWTDPRLAYRKRPGVETLSVGSEFIKNIWVPDTFFVNEKQSYFHIATTSNEFIRVHHSGSITRSIRWVVKNIYQTRNSGYILQSGLLRNKFAFFTKLSQELCTQSIIYKLLGVRTCYTIPLHLWIYLPTTQRNKQFFCY